MTALPASARAEGPLSRRLVLDLTQFLAGPYAGQIFGDLGARVIKIEPPGGEMARTLAPHFVKGESAYFLAVNRNKESLAVDLKHPRGQAIVLDLVRRADIVLEAFRPGVAARLGLDYATLKAANPKIIVCSISGFGQDGPYRDRPAYDIVVQAMSVPTLDANTARFRRH
jgi:CoA:oxalate CoA-transferase